MPSMPDILERFPVFLKKKSISATLIDFESKAFVKKVAVGGVGK